MAVASRAPQAQGGATPRAPEEQYRRLSPGPGMLPADVAADQIERLQSATIEVVAKHGYGGAKVREIARLAGVSTKAFYKHFDSKQDCVLQTYKLVVRRASRRIIASQAGEHDWRERVQLVLTAFAKELKAGPSAGRFVLVEAGTVGPAASEQVRRAEVNFEALLAECLARGPKGVVVPPLVVEGVVAGVARVASTRLAAGRTAEVSKLTAELAEWALCYTGEQAGALEELDMRSLVDSKAEPTKSSLNGSGNGASSVNGDRALILSAVAKLTVSDGYSNLTVPRIRRAAGVSRRTFDVHFDGVEDCFTTALDRRGGEVLSRAALAQVSCRTWSGGLYRAIVTLCDQIAEDHLLASVCLNSDFDLRSRSRQSRQRLIGAVAEQLTGSVPSKYRPTKLALEATEGAVWGLFQNHVVKDWTQRPKLAATLAYVALAPVIGSSGAIAAIRCEQKG